MSATEQGISSFNPTAAFEVTVAGLSGAATQKDPNGLARVVVETHLDKIGMVSLTYSGHIKPSDVKIGADVTVSVGGDSAAAFTGIVTGLRHSWVHGKETIIVEAMDPLIKLSASRETKVWGGQPTDKIKDSVAASDVISAGGCTEGTVDATSGESPYIFQRNESNLTFIKRLAARNGYLVYCDSEGKVNFMKPQFSGAALEVKQGDIIRLEYQRTDTDLAKGVEVTGWDYITKKRVVGINSAITAIGSGSLPRSLTFKNDTHISDVLVSSEAGAKAMATAEMDRLGRTFVRGSCTIPGQGKLRVGKLVSFQGSFEGFNPSGYVVAVRHVIEPGQTFQTTFWFVGNTEPA